MLFRVRKALAILGICAALACAKSPDRPMGVRATATARGIDVSWEEASGADAYRVQLIDLDSGASLAERGHGARDARHAAGCVLAQPPACGWTRFRRARRGVRQRGGRETGRPGRSSARRTFTAACCERSFRSWGADERLGVLLVNAGGRDQAQATVEVKRRRAGSRRPGAVRPGVRR